MSVLAPRAADPTSGASPAGASPAPRSTRVSQAKCAVGATTTPARRPAPHTSDGGNAGAIELPGDRSRDPRRRRAGATRMSGVVQPCGQTAFAGHGSRARHAQAAFAETEFTRATPDRVVCLAPPRRSISGQTASRCGTRVARFTHRALPAVLGQAGVRRGRTRDGANTHRVPGWRMHARRGFTVAAWCARG